MGTKYEVNQNTGDITGTGTLSIPAGHFSQSLTISGVPVSTGTSGGVSGSFAYTHTQASPATTWTIDHALNTFTPQVIVYNSTNKVIMPDTASGVSLNQFLLTFNQSLAGKAFLTAAGTQTDLSSVGNISANSVTATVITGTLGQFGGTLSAQNVSASTSLTVSGVPVPLASFPHRYADNRALSNQAYTASSEVDVTGLTGLLLPTGHYGSTNGRTYRITGSVQFNNTTALASSIVASTYYGPNGGKGENLASSLGQTVASLGSQTVSLGPWQFTVTSGTATKFGVSVSSAQNGTILAQGSQTSVLVELVG